VCDIRLKQKIVLAQQIYEVKHDCTLDWATKKTLKRVHFPFSICAFSAGLAVHRALPIEDFDGETFGKRAGNLPWFRRGFGTALLYERCQGETHRKSPKISPTFPRRKWFGIPEPDLAFSARQCYFFSTDELQI
jgi:hypothetical protein